MDYQRAELAVSLPVTGQTVTVTILQAGASYCALAEAETPAPFPLSPEMWHGLCRTAWRLAPGADGQRWTGADVARLPEADVEAILNGCKEVDALQATFRRGPDAPAASAVPARSPDRVG